MTAWSIETITVAAATVCTGRMADLLDALANLNLLLFQEMTNVTGLCDKLLKNSPCILCLVVSNLSVGLCITMLAGFY